MLWSPLHGNAVLCNTGEGNIPQVPTPRSSQPGAWQVCAPACGNAKHNWQLLRELSCHVERGDQMVASSALSKRSRGMRYEQGEGTRKINFLQQQTK